jgi:hypothetical protein
VKNLSGRAKFLLTAVASAGAIAAAVRAATMGAWSGHDVQAWAVLTILVVATESLPIPLRHRTETENFTLTDAVWMAALLVAGPGVLTLSAVCGVLLGQAVRRWAPHKIAFNLGQSALAATAAEVVFRAIGPRGAEDPRSWVAAAVAVGVAVAISTALVALIIAVVEGEPFRRVLMQPGGLNLLHSLGNMGVGLLGAVLWTAHPLAIPALVVPVVTAYLAYRSHAALLQARGRVP